MSAYWYIYELHFVPLPMLSNFCFIQLQVLAATILTNRQHATPIICIAVTVRHLITWWHKQMVPCFLATVQQFWWLQQKTVKNRVRECSIIITINSSSNSSSSIQMLLARHLYVMDNSRLRFETLSILFVDFLCDRLLCLNHFFKILNRSGELSIIPHTFFVNNLWTRRKFEERFQISLNCPVTDHFDDYFRNFITPLPCSSTWGNENEGSLFRYRILNVRSHA